MMIYLVILNAVLLVMAVRFWRQCTYANQALQDVEKELTKSRYQLDMQQKRNTALHVENNGLRRKVAK